MASYVTGSGIEVPGLEAILEYGDSSKIAHDAIPGAMRVNDRSILEQIRLSQLSGLHDDPDGRDSRADKSDQHGEDAGIMLYGGRTVGLTGQARAGSIPAMRDVWRRFRSQFGVGERDLLIHPIGETPSYTNLVINPNVDASISQWSGDSGNGGGALTAGVSDGDFLVGQFAVTGLTGSSNSLVIQNLKNASWSGESVYIHALVKISSATATVSAIKLRAFSSLGGTQVVATQATPTTGTWYSISGVVSAASLLAAGAISLLRPQIEVDATSAGNVTIRFHKVTMVFLSEGQTPPVGWIDGTAPGFYWQGDAISSYSSGPSLAVNQITDSTCSNESLWTTDISSGVTTNTKTHTNAWGGDLTSSSILCSFTASASGKKMSFFSPESIAVAGHSYRLTAKLNILRSDVGHIDAQVVWLDRSSAVISASTQSFVGAGIFDVEIAATAPAGAFYVRATFGNVVNTSTAGSQQSIFALSDPCLVDTTYSTPPPFVGLGGGWQEIAVGNTSSGVGAVRRISRPFLLKNVRKTSDIKAPEQQTGPNAWRDFTMSLRAADPRIYMLDLRNAVLKLVGTPQLVTKQSEVFTLNSHPAPVPTGFTYEGQSIPALMEWTTGPFYPSGTTYPQSAISPKLWDSSTGIAITDPASDVVARVYRSAESYVYQQPRVVLGCAPTSRRADSVPLGRYYSNDNTTPYNNSARILLKRVNSTTWLELRWYTGSHASSLAGWISSPADAASPYTFELWCSHNTSGTLGATRLAQADYTHWPTSYIQAFPSNVPFDPQTQPQWLVAYMLSNVVYWELWESYPSADLSARVESGSYALPSALQTLIGSSVSGSAGYSLVVPKTDDATGNWPNMAFAPPFVHYFEATKADVAPQSMSIPVIGSIDTPPVIQLRGGLVDPVLSMSTPAFDDQPAKTSFAKFIGTMSDDNPITIDLGDDVSVTDSQGNNAYGLLQPGGEFLPLQPGTNSVTLNATNWDTSAPSHIFTTWRDAIS